MKSTEEIEKLANELVSLHSRHHHPEMIDVLLRLSDEDADRVIARIEKWGYKHIATPALKKALQSERSLRAWRETNELI